MNSERRRNSFRFQWQKVTTTEAVYDNPMKNREKTKDPVLSTLKASS